MTMLVRLFVTLFVISISMALFSVRCITLLLIYCFIIVFTLKNKIKIMSIKSKGLVSKYLPFLHSHICTSFCKWYRNSIGTWVCKWYDTWCHTLWYKWCHTQYDIFCHSRYNIRLCNESGIWFRKWFCK